MEIALVGLAGVVLGAFIVLLALAWAANQDNIDDL